MHHINCFTCMLKSCKHLSDESFFMKYKKAISVLVNISKIQMFRINILNLADML